MILPGHVAASILCHRHLKVDLRVALVAGVIPDVIDKLLYYGPHLVPSSRVPMHTLLAWGVSTLLVALIERLVAALRINEGYGALPGSGKGRGGVPFPWAVAWGVGYGAHLLCDSPLVGGKIPFLYPFRAYDFTSPVVPLSFLFGMNEWPLHMLIAELLLVIFTAYTEWRRMKARRLALKPNS